jgi:hypothetical protein
MTVYDSFHSLLDYECLLLLLLNLVLIYKSVTYESLRTNGKWRITYEWTEWNLLELLNQLRVPLL